MIDGMRARLPWHAARVAAIRSEGPGAATIALSVPGWPGHLAGQHLDLRLTAEDGYQAQRSYSIASTADATTLDITVEEIPGGEVSPFLLHELAVGDVLELRGPIGGYFTWQPGEGGPLLLVGGGSGIVPLMAILRQRAKAGDRTVARVVYSAARLTSLIYRDELERMVASGDGVSGTYTRTREQPPGWTGERRRIDRAMLETAGIPADLQPRAFVCGPTPMVEQVAADLVTLRYQDSWIKTERFGPTGDAT
jgi:ferredoxin-NADP reductase